MPEDADRPAPRGGRAFGVPARRQAIITLLTEAYARNDLEQEELERRLELAERARTIEELEALIEDFPEHLRRAPAPAGAGAPASQPAPVDDRELERQVAALDGLSAPTRFSLLGDQRLAVSPAQPRVLQAVTAVGDTTVDLRSLSGTREVFLLKVAALIGDTRILVPKDTRVEMRLFTLIGSQSRKTLGKGFLGRMARRLGVAPGKPEAPPAPPGPPVVVTGFKLIGDTTVIEE